ncbi:MAG: tRNA (adenosine(37)-N6)-threonylcarbamoyltransferase complex transferase subunit TsaD [Candidatus Dojkabacteria bacterium]|nr:MAG: tRNA (adenosine(37)-N6)-threonylcarbamoyltransferase complex transferase subunit TsaD [Candidatus Dojkabacteria bacterium]
MKSMSKSALKINENSSEPLILAVDTSCDETSVAILRGRNVITSIVSSQTELHKKWGGIVPHVARRAHEENLPKAYAEAMKRAGIDDPKQFDAVAVTKGPGLAVDLEVGIDFIKQLAINENIPLIEVNHMEGHFLSSLALNSEGHGSIEDFNEDEYFPALGLLVSGKHTEIVYSEKIGQYKKIGWTLDDAAGEAFDKFGRMMGFGYPAGPVVSEFAKKGKPNDLIELPIPLEKSKDLNFSYSGLKTASLYRINELREQGLKDKDFANDFCYAFVQVIVDSIVLKLEKALQGYPEAKSVFAGGGVLKNEKLSRSLSNMVRSYGVKFNLPDDKYRTDNAVMIGIVAYYKYLRGEISTTTEQKSRLDRNPRLEIGN